MAGTLAESGAARDQATQRDVRPDDVMIHGPPLPPVSARVSGALGGIGPGGSLGLDCFAQDEDIDFPVPVVRLTLNEPLARWGPAGASYERAGLGDTVTTIDVHAHIVPEDCLDFAAATGPDGREHGFRLELDAAGTATAVVDGRPAASIDAEQLWNVERRLREMDAGGVDIQALSVPPFLFLYMLDAAQAHDRARRFNDGIAAVVQRHPDRFIGMATVPLQDTDRALDELNRATGTLGMRGVAIQSNVAGENLDAPRLFPFFERVAALGIPIFIHPNNVAAADRLRDYYLTNLLGNPLDTTIAAASLIFGGVFARLPGLKVYLAHGGGTVPYVCGRWQHGWHVRPEPKRQIERPPMEDVRRLYFDTITHSPDALGYLVRTFGADHVMTGTDYPFDMGDTRPTETVDALGLSAGEREMVLGGTAARLFGLSRDR